MKKVKLDVREHLIAKRTVEKFCDYYDKGHLWSKRKYKVRGEEYYEVDGLRLKEVLLRNRWTIKFTANPCDRYYVFNPDTGYFTSFKRKINQETTKRGPLVKVKSYIPKQPPLWTDSSLRIKYKGDPAKGNGTSTVHAYSGYSRNTSLCRRCYSLDSRKVDEEINCKICREILNLAPLTEE